MSHLHLAILAATVTAAGLTVAVTAAHLIRANVPRQSQRLAIACLLMYGLALISRPDAWPLIDLAVLLGAIGGILWIERGLQTPTAVAVFLSVAAVVDVVSMSGGLSRTIVQRYQAGTSNLLLYLALVAPIRGRVIPIVGIGDLLVGGAAATALLRLKWQPAYVLGAVLLGLMIALAYGLWRGGTPALPFIAVVVIGLVWRQAAASKGPK